MASRASHRLLQVGIGVALGSALAAPGLGQSAVDPQVSPLTYATISREANIPAPEFGDISSYLADAKRIEDSLSTIELQNKVLAANGKAVQTMVSMAPGPVGSVLNTTFEVINERVNQAATERFEDAREQLYTDVFARVRRDEAADFAATFGDSITPENYELARQLVDGSSASLAVEMKKRREQDAETIQAEEIKNLDAALKRAIALGASQDAQLDARITENSQAIVALTKDLADFRSAVTREVADLKAGQVELKEAVTLMRDSVGQNTSDIAFMQDVLWGRMTAAEQRRALEAGSFFKGMAPDKREQLLTRVRRLEVIEKAQTYMSGASALVTIAGKLGVLDADSVRNVQQNIGTAQAAANVASLIVNQNWFGALNAATGLFGGQEDAGAAQHAEIMSALRQISAQIEELRGITVALRQEVQTLRVEMHARFDHVDSLLALLNEKENATFLTALAQCAKFVNAITAFNNYGDRLFHFNKNFGAYGACLSYMSGLLAELGPVSIYLTSKAWTVPEQGTDGVVGRRPATDPNYPFMTNLTFLMIGADGGLDQCLKRGLSIFASIAIQPGVMSCTGEMWSGLDPYISSNHATVDAVAVLSDQIHIPKVDEIGGYLIAMAPYQDLAKYERLTLVGLKTLEELAVPDTSGLSGPADELFYFQDIVNFAIAQQAMLSGTVIARRAAEVIAGTKFRHVVEPCIPAMDNFEHVLILIDIECENDTARADQEGGKPGGCSIPANQNPSLPFKVACQLWRNPIFLENVGLAMGQAIVESTGRLPYAAILASKDQGFMMQLLRDPRLGWLAIANPKFVIADGAAGARYPNWSVEIMTPEGPVLAPLPTPSEAIAGRSRMTPGWSHLQELRRRVSATLFGMNADEAKPVDGGPPLNADMIRSIGLLNPAAVGL